MTGEHLVALGAASEFFNVRDRAVSCAGRGSER